MVRHRIVNAILYCVLFVSIVAEIVTVNAGRESTSTTLRPWNQKSLVESLSKSKKGDKPVGVAKFLTSIISSTSLREIIGIDSVNSIVMPLLGVLRLPKDTISLKGGVIALNVNIKGYAVRFAVHAGDDMNFRISLSLPTSFSDESVSSSLESTLASGNHGFLSRLLNGLKLGGAEISVGASCNAKTLIIGGLKGDCKPIFSLEGTSVFTQKIGDLPSLGKVSFRLVLSRTDGLHVSIDAPELHNKKLVLSPGVGSIAIRSGSIQVEIGHKLVNPFLDRIVGAFGIFKKKNATLALTENEGRRGNYLQEVLAESWSSEIPEKGNLTISLKGSIDIELLSYSGSAEVALSFDSGAGGISFSVTNIAHPSLSISGLAFKLSEISYESARRFFEIKGSLDFFHIPLDFAASIQNATQDYRIVSYVRLTEDHGEVDLERVAETKLPGILKKIRITKLAGELDLSTSEIDLFAEIEGIALDRLQFKLELAYFKAKEKRPTIVVKFEPKLTRPLPIFELIPSLASIPVLNAIEFESLSVSRFRVNTDGFYSLNISSIIVLWGSRISLHGMYDGSNKTYAFSMASLQDSKPMTLISMIPAFASVPVAQDVSLNSFSIDVSKDPKFSNSKVEIRAEGSFHAFDIKFEGSFGGDLKSPQFLFETIRSPARAADAARSGLSFLNGLPVGGFLLDKISGSLEEGTLSLSVEGSAAHSLVTYSGQLVLDLKNKTGSLDIKLDSVNEKGTPLPEIFSFLQRVPILEKISFVSASLTIHREENKKYSGFINLRSRLWSIPVLFMASFSDGKVSVTLSTDPGDKEGLLLSEHFPQLKNIDGLADATVDTFIFKVEKETDSKSFVASFNGKGELFGVEAEMTMEYLSKGLQASFSASSKDSNGIPIFSRVSWLRNIPVIKDIRFLSAQVVGEFPEENKDVTLLISATGSIGPVLLSFNANLKKEMKSVVLQTTPNSGRDSVPLSELVPIGGVVAEILGKIKLAKFTFSATLLGDDSSVRSSTKSHSRVQISLACELELLGIDFSGSFKYVNEESSISLSPGSLARSRSLDIASILPQMKSIAEFLGTIQIGNVEISYAEKVFRFQGSTTIFRVRMNVKIEIDNEKNIYFSARAQFTRDVLTIASLIPSLKNNDILKSFGIADIGISLNKTKEGTVFTMEGSAQLFHVPVTASLLMGPNGRLELKIFTPQGRKIALSSIIPSVSNIPVLKSLSFQDLIVEYERESSKSDSLFRLGGEVEIIGIGLRADLYITSKGFTVSGTADFSRVKTSNAFLKRMMTMCRRFGVMVTSYTHAEPLLDNRILEQGTVAVFGDIGGSEGFDDVSGSVDKVTGSSGSVSGLRFTGMISPDISKCSLSILMPLSSVQTGKKGSTSSGLELYFSGLGPSFALKFRLSMTFEKDVITFVAAIAIRPTMLSLSGSLVGRWTDPFGLRNTYIENLAVQAGINIQTGLPAEFGFMGTIFVDPIHLSVAVAIAVDGGILVSGSINILSMQALFQAARTLGAPIPESFDSRMPPIELQDLRLYIASRPMTIGEFHFNPGFSFAAGLKIYSFAAYVSVSVGEDGVKVFGAMSSVKLGPLNIDRDPTFPVPDEVSRLGPSAQNLPKEISSISEAEKIASLTSLAQLNQAECRGQIRKRRECKLARTSFTESMLPRIYNGPVFALSMTKGSQMVFFSGRIRLLGNTISVNVYLSPKRLDFKAHFRIFGFVTADFEAGADINTMSNIRIKVDVRVADVRESILDRIRQLFGLDRKEKKRKHDAQTKRDAQAAEKSASREAERRYRECVVNLPEKQQNNQFLLDNCARRINFVENSIIAFALGERVAALYEIQDPSSEMKIYREHLSSVLIQYSTTGKKSSTPSSFSLVESTSEAQWKVMKRIKRGVKKAVNAVKKVVTNVFNAVVKFVKKATQFIKRVAIAAAKAIVAAAKAVWRFIGEVIFSVVYVILKAFWLHRVHFEADIGSLTNPGRVSAGLEVALMGKDYQWSFTWNLGGAKELIKKAAEWLWQQIKKIAKWF